MTSKTIFLMGAPLPSHLDWENDALLNTPVPPFQGSQTSSEDKSFTEQTSVKWRVLQPLPQDGYDARHSFYYGPPDFLTTHQLETTDNLSEEDSILSQFYDHSFAVHETNEMSASDVHEGTPTQTESSGLDSVEISAESSEGQLPDTAPRLRVPGPVSDLGNVPTARYLQSIAPQTMTVNLVVGVIAVHPPRRVVTRQWKSELDIVELIVGDDTRTGFGVNFWLYPERPSSAKTQEIDRLRQSLATLRSRDIILLRTIGLSSFQDRVYGQSLRGGMTQVVLLHRRLVDTTDAGGFYQSIPPPTTDDDQPLQKTRRVREWMVQFMGATHAAGGQGAGMPTQRGPELPPDTQ